MSDTCDVNEDVFPISDKGVRNRYPERTSVSLLPLQGPGQDSNSESSRTYANSTGTFLVRRFRVLRLFLSTYLVGTSLFYGDRSGEGSVFVRSVTRLCVTPCGV